MVCRCFFRFQEVFWKISSTSTNVLQTSRLPIERAIKIVRLEKLKFFERHSNEIDMGDCLSRNSFIVPNTRKFFIQARSANGMLFCFGILCPWTTLKTLLSVENINYISDLYKWFDREICAGERKA